MRFFKIVLLAFLAGQLSGCDGNVAPNSILSDNGFESVIYGTNSIQEVPAGHPNADASVVLVKKEAYNLFHEKNMAYTVSEVYGIDDFPWTAQPSLGFCSGFLIAEDIVLTAGHCVAEENICADIRVVMNYDKGRMSEAMTAIECQEILKAKNDIIGQGMDYALIKLKKSMGIMPVKVAQQEAILGDRLYTLGYPLGSFKKKATGIVRQVIPDSGIYIANLDIFEGNSGSPVFSEKTHELIGVVSGGEDDFVKDSKEESLLRVKRCANKGCKGEFITPIQKILADSGK